MRSLAPLVAIAVAACGPRAARPSVDGVPWASAGIDWSHPPSVPAHDASVRPLPAASEAVLANGVRVIVVENHRVPLVAVSAVHLGAGGREDGARHGLAALTADVLVDGTDIEAVIASDHASNRLVATTAELPARLDDLGALLRSPLFDDAAIIRARQRRIAQLGERRDNARTIAAQTFDHVVFGEHPYAWPAEGVPDVVAQLGHADVRGFWERAYRPDALVLIFSGDITPSVARTLVEQRFGSWTARAQPSAPPPVAALPPYVPTLAIVDRPGASDAVVIVGRRLDHIPSSAQAASADVGSAIVGDGSIGRLQHRLHDELGLTIGASASFWRGDLAWTWTAAATFQTDRALAGIHELLDVIVTARSGDARESEVALAKTTLQLALEQQGDTDVTAARALERLVARRLPLAAYQAQAAEMAGVTAGSARTAMDRAGSDLSIVIVGDRQKLGALDTFGLPVKTP